MLDKMTSNRQRNLSESDHDSILEDINDDTFNKLIPAIAICGAFSLIGTIGNSLSVFVFASRMKRNFQNNLFIYLCVVNVLACAVCIPGDIVDLRFTYMYPTPVACKMTRFFNMFTMAGSVLTLGTLSVYRLRAASTARMSPSSNGSSLRGIFALVLGSVGIAWLGPVIYGIHTSPTRVKDIMGRDCSIDDAISNTPWQLGFYTFLGVGFFTLILTVAISYYKIWRIVKVSRMAVAAHTTISVASPVATGRDTLHILHANTDCSEFPSSFSTSENKTQNETLDNAARYSHAIPTITTSDLSISGSHLLSKNCNDISLFSDERPSTSSSFETSGGRQERAIPVVHENNMIVSTKTRVVCNELNFLANANDNGNMKNAGKVDNIGVTRPYRNFNNKIGRSLKVTDWKGHHGEWGGASDIMKSEVEFEEDIPKRSFSVREDRKIYVVDSSEAERGVTHSDVAFPARGDDLSTNYEVSSESVAASAVRELDLIGLIDQTSPERLKPKTNNAQRSSQNVIRNLFTSLPVNAISQEHNFEPTIDSTQITARPDSMSENLATQRPFDSQSFQNSLGSSEVENNESTINNLDRSTLNKKTNKIKPLKKSDTRLMSTTSNVKVKNTKTSLEIAITRTAFLLTFTFIVSYLPFFIASIPHLIIPDFDYSEDPAKLNLINMAYRLYFVNPTISPFIFWASNLDFRRKFKTLCS